VDGAQRLRARLAGFGGQRVAQHRCLTSGIFS
jgi:hypothetical protein